LHAVRNRLRALRVHGLSEQISQCICGALPVGAARVIACATHGVFSGPAYERLAFENSRIERIVVTDTMPLRDGAPENITVLSTAQTLADSIRRIFSDDSVSEIFAGENQLF
jgi:ribose-phosphate pyrophosphokinase